MAIPETGKYLPTSEDMRDTFSLIRHGYSQTISTQNFEDLAELTKDALLTGFAYLAIRGHDNYMQEIGTISWRMVKNPSSTMKAKIVVSDDMISTAIELGAKPEDAIAVSSNNDHNPCIILATSEYSNSVESKPNIVLPSGFVARVLDRPIGGLATIAWICSQLRDIANNRLSIDQENIPRRALASSAHFLLEACKRYPLLAYNSRCFSDILLYPRGIGSLSDRMMYQDISRAASLSA